MPTEILRLEDEIPHNKIGTQAHLVNRFWAIKGDFSISTPGLNYGGKTVFDPNRSFPEVKIQKTP